MAMKLTIGLDAITSYRRLDYTPWHALAEFVDNSTQSYFNNREVLDAAFEREGRRLEVGITYDAKENHGTGFLRVSDNAMGMSYTELQRALHIAQRPPNASGRSKYGLGLKTAACWLGNQWTIRTKKLGETTEYRVEINVDAAVQGNGEVKETRLEGRPATEHYTIIEITQHNRAFQGRTLGKIRQFLESMYRQDFRNGNLTLEWQGVPLSWAEQEVLVAYDGTPYKKSFEFKVNGKRVYGWVGLLAKGSREDAGFSILYYDRVIKGYPDSWRPSPIFGQHQGSNDLVNQRLFGEVHLDDFEVSHTKDAIEWMGDEEEQVENGLAKASESYRQSAKDLHYRKGHQEERGPSDLETQVAVEELQKELESPEMVDAIQISVSLPEQVIEQTVSTLAATVADRHETFRAKIADLAVFLYLVDWSPNDPYIVTETADPNKVVIIVNTAHPHWLELKGSDGVLNYLRHCTYDGIAEWQASRKSGRIDPNTIKMYKDRLLRVPLEIEANAIG